MLFKQWQSSIASGACDMCLRQTLSTWKKQETQGGVCKTQHPFDDYVCSVHYISRLTPTAPAEHPSPERSKKQSLDFLLSSSSFLYSASLGCQSRDGFEDTAVGWMPTGESARRFWFLSVAYQGWAPLLIPKGGAAEPQRELGLTQLGEALVAREGQVSGLTGFFYLDPYTCATRVTVPISPGVTN